MYIEFTDEARWVMQIANQEAMRLSQDYIGPEHVLLGLISEDSGDAAKTLAALGLDLQKTRAAIEKLAQRRIDAVGKRAVPAVRATKIIEQAIQEARNYAHDRVSSGHILLALLRSDDADMKQILTDKGITFDTARNLLSKLCTYD